MNRIIRNILLISLFPLLMLSIYLLEIPSLPQQKNTAEEIKGNIPGETLSPVRLQTPDKLAAHFPDQHVITEQILVEEEIISVPEETGPILTGDLKYIASAVKSNEKLYYFKLSRSGKILSLAVNREDSAWKLLSVEDDFFLLRNGEETYKVNK